MTQARIAELELMLDERNERIMQLEKMLGVDGNAVPLVFGLTKSEAALLEVIMGRDIVEKTVIHDILYSEDPDPPEVKIIDVFVCKVRKKLQPFGVQIGTIWGRGYHMPAADKQRTRELAAQERAA